MTRLTDQERETLRAAEAIIVSHTPTGATWSFGFHCKGFFPTAAYFDSNRDQHMLWQAHTLLEAIEAGIYCESNAAADSQAIKARKVAQLKAQLAELEAGEA